MKIKGQAMLQALLHRSPHGEELLPFLPSSLIKEGAGNAIDKTLFKTLFTPSDWSKQIHHSWFAELFKEYPSEVQILLLATLRPSQIKGIQMTLPHLEPTKTLAPFLTSFLDDFLRKTLEDTDLLPELLLPVSPLNVLLKIERKYLIQMIDLLGIYDLATDLKQIVDKELLNKIYTALSTEQVHFLHYCSKQAVKWISPKLGLTSWDGTNKQLNRLLHHRGLIRLAKAIHQEHASFKWHLAHRFDTGRSKIIQKELYQKQNPSFTPYFKNQVLHVAKRYPT